MRTWWRLNSQRKRVPIKVEDLVPNCHPTFHIWSIDKYNFFRWCHWMACGSLTSSRNNNEIFPSFFFMNLPSAEVLPSRLLSKCRLTMLINSVNEVCGVSTNQSCFPKCWFSDLDQFVGQKVSICHRRCLSNFFHAGLKCRFDLIVKILNKLRIPLTVFSNNNVTSCTGFVCFPLSNHI